MSGEKCLTRDPIGLTIDLLKKGNIIAIKGIGGFHLMCDATESDVIANLRTRKRRPDKPLALMMNKLTTVRKYCNVGSMEEEILTGIRRPIVLLDKKGEKLPRNIAPGIRYYGVMLPYTPPALFVVR